MVDHKKELKFYISVELDGEFRKRAMERYGYRKGSISKAAEEAIAKWNKLQSITQSAEIGQLTKRKKI